MLDVEAIRKRARVPTPPVAVCHGGETSSQAKDIEIQNNWLAEWAADKRDLLAALKEIELLRSTQTPELVERFQKLVVTKTSLDEQMKALEGLFR